MPQQLRPVLSPVVGTSRSAKAQYLCLVLTRPATPLNARMASKRTNAVAPRRYQGITEKLKWNDPIRDVGPLLPPDPLPPDLDPHDSCPLPDSMDEPEPPFLGKGI